MRTKDCCTHSLLLAQQDALTHNKNMPGSLPAQSQKKYSSQPELNDNWTKASYKRGRSTQEETEREAKHAGSTKLPLPITTQLY
jgi:hypothetical protein